MPFFHNFIYFCLCWVFIAMQAFSVIAVSMCYSSCSVLTSHCSGFSCCGAWALGALRLQQLRFPGSSSCGHHSSVAGAHGLSCSVACGDFPDQGSNPCALQQQMDSLPLNHQQSLNNVIEFLPTLPPFFLPYEILNT